ncbi:hypothetical protein N9W97_02910 [Pseudomonadales bacterium]|nr:hypothetical protein [Pseudomonadales bacterium]
MSAVELFADFDKEYIKQHWAREKERFPWLYDTLVFYVDGFSEDVLSGCWAPFSYGYCLGLKVPSVPKGYLRPLAVTGICKNYEGQILLGNRSDFVSEHKGLWDLLPSGSVDITSAINEIPDPLKQLKSEFEEELGKEFIFDNELVAINTPVGAGPIDLIYTISLTENFDLNLDKQAHEEHRDLAFYNIKAALELLPPTSRDVLSWCTESKEI